MKILFLGDIDGKPGRRAVARVLPAWKVAHDFDLVIANGENMAHGKGFSMSGFEEMQKAGVDFFTSGNHWPDQDDGMILFSGKTHPVIRPANWLGRTPGQGWRTIEVGTTKVAIINLIGQVFVRTQSNSPFEALDRILGEIGSKVKVVVVDFHAEATSEKQAFGWHADGRVSAVIGTHSHVPTADARLLLQGTAYVTDAGMCGMRDSVIGDSRESRVRQFLDQMPAKHEIDEHGVGQVNAVVLEVDAKTGTASSIVRLDAEVEV
ncbi:MAG: YmdB family metallophosphoesterase [Parcubacteria group bacterium]|nr:YmdB family metallophosphoesterase [Parcubacteria group bacterium]